MRFYTQQHQYYCGIDLHARAMGAVDGNLHADLVVLMVGFKPELEE